MTTGGKSIKGAVMTGLEARIVTLQNEVRALGILVDEVHSVQATQEQRIRDIERAVAALAVQLSGVQDTEAL